MATLDEQLAMNVHLFQQRLELADRVEVPREVEHFAYFRRRSTAETAQVALERDGYVVTLDRRVTKTLLVATKDSAVDLATTDDFTRSVSRVITGAGGSYDGWGAAVVR